MSELISPEAPTLDNAAATLRALLVCEGADDGLTTRLSSAGFEVVAAAADEAAGLAAEVSPAVVLLAFGRREGEGQLTALARRLRSSAETFGLPVVFLYRTDERTLRSAARHLGVDDYFSLEAPQEELRARLSSLLWRVEAGRRSAPAAADQRSEIDNFIFLLDAVADDARREGARGSVALVEAAVTGADPDGRRASRALASAHAFLKLNLRRVDAAAFYGPATLLVYLHGQGPSRARETLSRLAEEFTREQRVGGLLVGVSSFPDDGAEVEALVERAEVELARARDGLAPTVGRTAATASTSPAVLSPVSRPAPAQSEAQRPRAGSLRLMLIVSDAARMAQINLLMRSAGYEVRAAFDGHHALNLLRIDRPDLLLVDYELHGMDGVEMLRRLGKQTGAGRAPRALVLLPGGREDLRREAVEAGARAVVGLPLDPVELLDKLRAVGGAV